MDENTAPAPAPAQPAPPAGPILRFEEGQRVFRGDVAIRTFTVITRELTDDLGIVAEAVSPDGKLAMPKPGGQHPDDPDFIAGIPKIYPQLSVPNFTGSKTRCFNVVLQYFKPKAKG